jgi:hypothetical protein
MRSALPFLALSLGAGAVRFGVEFNTWPLGVCDVVPFAQSGSWTLPSGGPAPVDAAGWPTSDAYVVLFDYAPVGYDPQSAVPASVWGVYTVSFAGKGTVTLYPGLGRVLNSTFDAAAFATLAFVELSAGPFGNTTPGLVVGVYGASRADGGGGFTGLRVLQPGCAPSAAPPPLLTPAAAAAIAPFAHVRLHEWFGTNTIPVDWPATAAWADRRALRDVFWMSGAGGKPRAVGAPWETALLASHAAGEKPVWVNVPVYASDDYVQGLVALLRGGGGGIPGLRCATLYVEHGNELWLNESNSPKNYAYNLAAAAGEVAADPASPLASGGERDPRAWARRRHAKRLREIHAAFAPAFAGSGVRVCAVFAWSQGYAEDARGALQWLEDTYGAGEAARAFCGFAVNGYHGPGAFPAGLPPLPDFSSPADVLAGVLAATDASRPARAASAAVAAAFGLPLMTYEGAGWPLPSGAGFNGAGFNATVAAIIAFNRANASAEAQAYDVAAGWPAGAPDVYNFYGLSSPYSQVPTWGSLGLCEDLGRAAASPKYAGALALIKAL